MKMTIEKDKKSIPIPGALTDRWGHGEVQRMMASLQVGESIVVRVEKDTSSLYVAARTLGMKIRVHQYVALRHTKGKPEWAQGLDDGDRRAWRIA